MYYRKSTLFWKSGKLRKEIEMNVNLTKAIFLMDVRNFGDTIVRKIAWLLPRRLVTWCFYRVFGYATQGDYGNTDVTEVTAMEVLTRWN